ncbi:hypothetical protein AAC387_Pa02g0657 [Persea americana]
MLVEYPHSSHRWVSSDITASNVIEILSGSGIALYFHSFRVHSLQDHIASCSSNLLYGSLGLEGCPSSLTSTMLSSILLSSSEDSSEEVSSSVSVTTERKDSSLISLISEGYRISRLLRSA